MKIPSSEHDVYIHCSECQNKKQFVYTACSELGNRKSIDNLLSYCGLVDARISTSDKDLPLQTLLFVLAFKTMFVHNVLNLYFPSTELVNQ